MSSTQDALACGWEKKKAWMNSCSCTCSFKSGDTDGSRLCGSFPGLACCSLQKGFQSSSRGKGQSEVSRLDKGNGFATWVMSGRYQGHSWGRVALRCGEHHAFNNARCQYLKLGASAWAWVPRLGVFMHAVLLLCLFAPSSKQWEDRVSLLWNYCGPANTAKGLDCPAAHTIS